MAKKFNPDEGLSPKELAKHLRKPSGERGKQVGEQMNKGNNDICLNTYKVLAPQKGDRILEIGMGNGFFVKDLLKMAEGLSYAGVDFSPTMITEANLINKSFIDDGKAEFKCASIEKIPFEDSTFDCITTTNTLYFWPQPKSNLKELLRVLKPNGKLLCAYRSRSCMDNLELTKFGFSKYDSTTVESLFKKSGFKKVVTETIKEPELEFDGKSFEMAGIFTSGLK